MSVVTFASERLVLRNQTTGTSGSNGVRHSRRIAALVRAAASRAGALPTRNPPVREGSRCAIPAKLVAFQTCALRMPRFAVDEIVGDSGGTPMS